MQFSDLNLIEPILRAVDEEGYTTPTPIQAQSIPIVLEGTDLLGCAQTGTGKTAAFAIPIIQLLSATKRTEKKRKIRSLILTPTRELAVQIKDSFQAYGRHTELRSTVVFGGVGQFAQVNTLNNGVDILIATPGRLMDLIQQKHISLADIEIFVLDEADRMLDMGFVHDVKKIIAMIPKKRQSLFFSATMPPEIVKLAQTILDDPSKVTVTPVSSTVDIIQQKIYYVDKLNKNHLLKHILKDENIKTALVFTRTKHGADKVVRMLIEWGIVAEAIHGNKGQNARQRALTNFKEQTTRVLVATDIAARGIDVDELEYVINYEMPNVAETYVHRIGRTGRAGAKWTAFSFCDAEEKAYLREIEELIAKKIPVVQEHPFPLKNNHEIREPEPQGRNGSNRPKPTPAKKPAAPHQGEKRFSERKPVEAPRRLSSSRYPASRRPSDAQQPESKKDSESRNTGFRPRQNDDKKKTFSRDDKPKTFGKPRDEKTGEKPKRVNKRAERSWSKNKEKAATLERHGLENPFAKKANLKPDTRPVEKKPADREKFGKKPTGKVRSPKPNPKPFVPVAPKRFSSK